MMADRHPGWQWLLDNEKRIHWLIGKSCKGAYYLRDELLEVVYDRIIGVYDRFDKSLGVKRSTYMLAALRGHMQHFMRDNYKQLAVEPLPDANRLPVFDPPELDNVDAVQYMLSSLCEQDRLVLSLKYLHGLDHSQIAEAVGCCRGTAWLQCRDAERRAREIWSGR
jgi:RNA polymerase sigma factor (sigma-70 family)